MQSGPRVSVVPPAGAAAAWRGVLWGRIEAMCEAFQRLALQAWNLAYVLAHARDANDRALLALDLCAGPAITAEVTTAGGAPTSSFLHPSALLLHRFWRESCASLELQVIYESKNMFTRHLQRVSSLFVRSAQ